MSYGLPASDIALHRLDVANKYDLLKAEISGIKSEIKDWSNALLYADEETDIDLVLTNLKHLTTTMLAVRSNMDNILNDYYNIGGSELDLL